MKIGIPRSMLYYDFDNFFGEFFQSLDIEVLVSPKTNTNILNNGVLNCVDEACLPIKIAHGHVFYLKNKVDYIFVPRIISSHKREYYCPKQLGLADMIRHNIGDIENLIDPILYLDSRKNIINSLHSLGRVLGKNRGQIRTASNNAYGTLRNLPYTDFRNSSGKLNILITGHLYNIEDSFINMDIKDKLKNKVNIIYSKDIESHKRRESSSILKKRMFWTHGHDIIGSAFYTINNNLIDGIIYLSAFGCGLDSVLVNLLEQKTSEKEIPLMIFNLDEQTGEAGFNTRLEAFLDMINWRWNNENKLSTSR